MEDVSTEAGQDELAIMAAGETSLLALVRTLLSPRTLPHVLMMMGVSLVLFLLANAELATVAALGFVSIALGYAVTGFLSSFSLVQRWTTLPVIEDEVDGQQAVASGALMRFIRPFRICLFPMFAAVLWAALLVSLLGESGATGDRLDSLPLLLSGLFVLWAIVQARSLTTWLSAVSAKRLPDSAPREGGTVVQIVVHNTLLLLLVGVLLAAFSLLGGTNITPRTLLTENAAFVGVVVGLGFISFLLTKEERSLAAGSAPLHRFAGRWLLFTQFFVLWHALTVWRHQVMDPPSALLLIEELMLMMFTVLMAIWGLTSKSVKSSWNVVHDGNALPMGLAFGYAYAGSVAMLTVVLDDIRTVMMAGHIVVLVAILWIQRTVLKRVIVRHDDQIRIVRAVANVNTEPHDEAMAPQTTNATQSVSVEADEGSALNPTEPAAPLHQDPVVVEWDNDDVEVLADEVDWGEAFDED